MRKQIYSAAVVAGFLLPMSAGAVEVVEDLLEVYGKIHVSADYHEADTDGFDDGVSFASNSSRIGFRGAYTVAPGLDVIYQFEQEVNIDDDHEDTFVTRESYLGAKGAYGSVALGRLESPAKLLGGRYTLFGDTVGDYRAIFSEGNIRADNALRYDNTFADLVKVSVLYATDYTGDSGSNSDASVEDGDLYSASVDVRYGGLEAGVAYQNIEDYAYGYANGASTVGEGELETIRLGAAYTYGPLRVGLLYEILDGDNAIYERDAWNLNAAYALTEQTSIMAQYAQADDNDAIGNSGAKQYTLGATHQVSKPLEVYAAYTYTDNDSNAGYSVIGGGHGDKLGLGDGEDGSALSVGAILSF